MKDNTKKVLMCLKKANGKNLTSADVAEAIGLTKKQVDGIFTMAIQKKDLGVRTPAQVQDKDGKYVNVNYLSLTDAGMALNLDAE